jgi:hypothetical protein
MYRETYSYPQRIVETEWIFSRKERLLLAATETTGKMPGGMKRLNHSSQYKQLYEKVQKAGNREQEQ